MLMVAEPATTYGRPISGCVLDVAQECISTGMRGPAQHLRQRVLSELSQGAELLTLDFRSVENATSSFLDELLGRLASELGAEAFRRKVRIVGLNELIERMANVVIHQRLEGLTAPIANTQKDSK